MNKGFTLVELIAVITILGLLAVITTPAYDTVSNNIKTRNYESKKSTIKNNTLSYVEKYYKGKIHINNTSNVLCLTVDDLIKKGIIASDSEKEEYIENNITGEKYSGDTEDYIKIYYDLEKLKLVAIIEGEPNFNNKNCTSFYNDLEIVNQIPDQSKTLTVKKDLGYRIIDCNKYTRYEGILIFESRSSYVDISGRCNGLQNCSCYGEDSPNNDQKITGADGGEVTIYNQNGDNDAQADSPSTKTESYCVLNDPDVSDCINTYCSDKGCELYSPIYLSDQDKNEYFNNNQCGNTYASFNDSNTSMRMQIRQINDIYSDQIINSMYYDDSAPKIKLSSPQIKKITINNKNYEILSIKLKNNGVEKSFDYTELKQNDELNIEFKSLTIDSSDKDLGNIKITITYTNESTQEIKVFDGDTKGIVLTNFKMQVQ